MSPITLGILAASGAGLPGDYELITSTVLSSTATSITFSSLATAAAGYKHLQIRTVDRSTASINSQMGIRFNGDAGANYSEHQIAGGGSGIGVYGGSSTNFAPLGSSPESGNSANLFGCRIIDILDWQGNKTKTIREFYGFAGISNRIALQSAAWYSTAAITTIEVFQNAGSFVAGSRFSLYGIRG